MKPQFFGPDLILLDKIAAGGMAEVYRGRQMGYGGFEKTVAIKRILPNFAQNEEFKSMFRAEANLTACLQHPNIAHVFANGEFEDYLYLVLEFVDGKNVRQILARADKKKVKIPVELSVFMVTEAAKGLNYAHDFKDEKTGEHLEIVHRDMSPQNVMLSYDGSVKIVDFGIAKAAARSGQTRAGVLKGKFGYMSPEQAQGKKLDRRTDIFALGIILFELLTQRRLFTADDDLKTLQLVKDCRVPRPSKYNPNITSALDTIVLKALTKNPAERYSTANELYADLVRYLHQQFPAFLHTDLSSFVRTLFAEDIAEERVKRERINADIPARPASPRKRSGVAATQDTATETKRTVDSAATEIGNASEDSTDADRTQSFNEGGKPSKATEVSLPPPSDNTQGPTTDELALDEITGASIPKARKPYLAPKVTNSDERPKIRAVDFERPRSPAASRVAVAVLVVACAALLVIFGPKKFMGGEPSVVTDNSSESTKDPAADSNPVAEEPAPVTANTNDVAEPTGKQIADIPPPPAPNPEPLSPAPAPVAVAPAPVNRVPAAKVDAPKPVATKSPPVAKVDRQPSGYLEINATPRATEIYINGDLLRSPAGVAMRTPVDKLALPPGQYNVELKNSFFGVTYKGSFQIQPDRISPMDVVLK